MWKQEIIDRQCESTKALMLAQNLRKEEDDSDYISLIKLTPIKKEAQCLKEDGTVDLNVRNLTQEETLFHEGVRRTRGSIIEKIRGDKPIYTINEEKKERAVSSFLAGSTMDAIKQRFKKIMEGIKETVKYGYSARNNNED